MSFFSILGTLLIRPLRLLFEVIYMMAERLIGNPGLSIIVLSLMMNFLVLPLYRRADAMQEEEQQTELRLNKGVAHIKKTFSGDERMMMLQTYYRQNNYKPTYVLRGATSLFLEIPFFIAAYQFLSTLSLLNGVSFGPIADLGKPDGLLTIAGLSVNILPIIMTAVNLVSCVIFTKGSLLKTKIQLYAMALFFLVFLYNSPSGLVFYWTLNNLFSLVKTIFYKLKHPGKVLAVLASIAGACLLVFGLFFYHHPTVLREVFFVIAGLGLQVPVLVMLVRARRPVQGGVKEQAQPLFNKKLFLSGAVFLAVLTGLLIPSAVIKASPQEFVDINYFYHPLWFIVSSFCLAFGTFVIWMGIFYWLASPAARRIFDRAVWVLCGAAIIDYMFFGKNLGILTAGLRYENGLYFSPKQIFINLAVLLAAGAVLYLLTVYVKKHLHEVLVIAAVAIVAMSAVNIVGIRSSVNEVKNQAESTQTETPQFTLSKTGQNVVVLMMDRGMAAYIPYIFNEKPELQKQFSGFTNYANTISFGGSTIFGSPAIFGGYEYTPLEMNNRSSESLGSKHNEALRMMPVLFEQNGYDVTVCDPTYAGYQWIPDLSIYDDYPDIHTYITKGKFTDTRSKKELIEDNSRNFFCYALMKTMPLFLHSPLYNGGDYNHASVAEDGSTTAAGQKVTGLYTSTGLYSAFMEPYNVLQNLTQITKVTKDSRNTFLMMTNDTTHDVMMLQEPDYTPSQNVDNTDYEAEHADRFTVDGQTLRMETELQVTHYQSNMAALLQLGEWFDYLRDNGVYDNTRIILVADHAFPLRQLSNLISDDGDFDAQQYYPLLMVKDFNAAGFTTSDEFMTNGDVPTLATSGLIENPTNPFTGKAIDSSEKTAHPQYVIASNDWRIDENNGNQFLPGDWYSVQSDMRVSSNWQALAKNATSPFAGN